MTAPLNVWLVTGTSIFAPYPCRCRVAYSGSCAEGCSPKYCPCSGRTDLGNVPRGCCAYVHTPAVAAAAQSR